ncbi:MAG TPA: potassium transporter TrkA [Methanoculleus sp.]|nr:potassium transporter TrkA [Methanoculleus sp.]
MIRSVKKLITTVLPDRRLRSYVIILVAQIIFYTALVHLAFPLLEGRPLSWIDALFFVIETITTVGYGEMLPFTSDLTTVIVLIIMITGVFTVLMIIPAVLTPFLAGAIRSTPPRRVSTKITGHVVIAGYGELTNALVDSLRISNQAVVVVDEREEMARAVRRRYGTRVHAVWGDYANPSTWTRVAIQHASDIVICEDERTAATIILGIREMTAARIIAVVDDLSFDRYLRYAGAEYVLSPKNATGTILARHTVLRPEVDTIYEAVSPDTMKPDEGARGRSLKLIKAPIMEGCRCIGKSLGDLDLFGRYGVEVLFFWKAGTFVLHPKEEDVLNTSTMLFLLGRTESLAQVLEEEFAANVTGEELAIIAGYGDVGKGAFRELAASGIRCVVVDPRAGGEGGLQGPETHVVTGEAEHEQVLTDAHIEDARFCIVAINDDDANIFTTLMARNLNPGLRILARANDPSSVDKLYRAGANYVALLPTIGGQVTAGIILADFVQVLLDLPDGQKVVMKHITQHAPTTAGWLEKKSGARILGIEREGRSVIRPGSREPLQPGDAVVAVGDVRTLKRFIRLLS